MSTREELLNIHTNYICAYLQWLDDPEDPYKYITHDEGGGMDECAPDYQDYPLDVIFRVFSCAPADVMVVLHNPGLSGIEDSPADEDQVLNRLIEQGLGEQLSESDPNEQIETRNGVPGIFVNSSWDEIKSNINQIRLVSAVGFCNWFIHEKTWEAQLLIDGNEEQNVNCGLKTLQNIEDLNDISLDSYQDDVTKYFEPDVELHNISGCDLSKSTPEIIPAFADIYFTNYVKLRTTTGGTAELMGHPASEKLAKQYLEEEIKAVSPDLLITLGNEATEAVHDINKFDSEHMPDIDNRNVFGVDNQTGINWLHFRHPGASPTKYCSKVRPEHFSTD